MAGCSYEALARFADSSTSFRVRSTDDIRRRQREALSRLRFSRKTEQMWQNRNLSHDGASSSWSENSCAWVESPSRSDSSSPTLSICSASSGLSDDFNLSCDFEISIHDAQARDRGHPKSRRQMLQARKLFELQHYDPQRIRLNYMVFKSHIEKYLHDAVILDSFMQSQWKVIDDTIQSPDQELATDCLDLLAILVSSKRMRSDTLLFLLQQCLMLRLRDAISQLNTRQSSIIELLIAMVHYEPKTAPFVVQLMENTQVLQSFEEMISMGSRQEVMLAFRLYQRLIEPCMMQLSEGSTERDIVLPQILLKTASPDSYSPASTLRRIISSNFIDTVASRFIKRCTSTEALLLQSAVSIFASCLEFVNSQRFSATLWLEEVRSQLIGLELDKSLEKSFSKLGDCQSENIHLLQRLLNNYHQLFVVDNEQQV